MGLARLAQVAVLELSFRKVIVRGSKFSIAVYYLIKLADRFLCIPVIQIRDPELVDRKNPLRLLLNYLFKRIDSSLGFAEVAICHSQIKQRARNSLWISVDRFFQIVACARQLFTALSCPASSDVGPACVVKRPPEVRVVIWAVVDRRRFLQGPNSHIPFAGLTRTSVFLTLLRDQIGRAHV